jgi:hypothetical protein
MATSLFHVKVLECSGVDATLELRIITGDQPDFDSGPSFALMLLYDPIDKELALDAPLARAVSVGQTTDPKWLDEHVDEYIDDAVLTNLRNHPVAVDLERMSPEERRDFFGSARAPVAVFEVTVTKPEWIAHLRRGMEWDTAAYDAFA